MTRPDPYSPAGDRLFECRGCGNRLEADRHPGECPDCGGEMVDIGVPRN